MDEPNKGPEGKPEEAGGSGQPKGLEHVYQNFKGVPVKYVDIFIWLCVAALVLVLVVGVLKGNGFI